LPERVDDAYDLVARGDQLAAGGQVAFREMQVGAANTANGYSDPYLTRPRGRPFPLY
jgi:hypothetical protein